MNLLRRIYLLLHEKMGPIRMIMLAGVAVAVALSLYQAPSTLWKGSKGSTTDTLNLWQAPDTATLTHTREGDLIRYGRKLITSTAFYLGPNGLAGKISNSMNCQNCHIEAGTKPFGNSFSAVASTYPVFRPRSGNIESIEFRINDCLQRSMNGDTLNASSLEMRAMVAYVKWIGKDVPKGTRPKGAGMVDLPYLDRPADPLKGKIIFESKCKLCHRQEGTGLRLPDGRGFVYPPLWGPESYNTGAGLFRLSRFAGFVRYNMPFGTKYESPQLTDEEAWDVAAFVNSMPRPQKVFSKDWPDIKKKAVDFPYGPYADNFSETQHKYGPFGPIRKAQEALLKKRNAGQ